MTPLLKVHPTWFACTDVVTSDTWRWLHFEKWSRLPAFCDQVDLPTLAMDRSAPSEYGSILRVALWIVAEAICRNGISRGCLSSEDMRWARRCGLALLGDRSVVDESGPLAKSNRAGHANSFMQQVVGLFPQQDRVLLGLSLEAPSATSDASRHRPWQPLESMGDSTQIQIDAKVQMLVRLAKRHAAARIGIDFRGSVAEHLEGAKTEVRDFDDSMPITLDEDEIAGALVSERLMPVPLIEEQNHGDR